MFLHLTSDFCTLLTMTFFAAETLVHSSLKHCENANFSFTYWLNMKEHTVYVKERPHLRTFLKKVAEMFKIVIFTASQSVYAEQLLDILDPDGKLISHRAYREACIFADGTCTKDLTVLGFDLAKVLIVDNTPQVLLLFAHPCPPVLLTDAILLFCRFFVHFISLVLLHISLYLLSQS